MRLQQETISQSCKRSHLLNLFSQATARRLLQQATNPSSSSTSFKNKSFSIKLNTSLTMSSQLHNVHKQYWIKKVCKVWRLCVQLQMEVLKILWHSLFLLLILVCFIILPSLPFPTYIFGDSLMDSGNNNYIFSLAKANSPPYGIDFKPSRGRPSGRFTNGRTISDLIGEAMGSKSFPPPYLAPNATKDVIHKGINYASGASGILDETGTLFIGRVPLAEQVEYFGKTRNHMVKLIGENGTKGLLKEAIFSVTIGSNDILNHITPDLPFLERDKPSLDVFQDLMVSNLTIQLKRLYKLGGRKFLVMGLGPLGCIPHVRALKLVPCGECSLEVNQMIQRYNAKLKLALHQLNRDLRSQAIFVYTNPYDIFLKIILNPRQYGFENALSPCCGGYFAPFICFQGSNTMTSSGICQNRSNYVFWDAYHPTDAANVIIAKELLDGGRSVTSPISVYQLYKY